MSETASTRAAAPLEEEGPELDRGGTGFVRPDVEAAYLDAEYVRSAPARLARARAALGFVVGLTAIGAALRGNGLAPWAPGIALVWVATLGLFGAVRLGRRVLSDVLVLTTNCMGTAFFVALGNFQFHSYGATLAGVVLACVFQVATGYQRPSQLLLAAAPYVAFEMVAAVLSQPDVVDVALTCFVLLAALLSSLTLATARHRAWRRAYRQERIIEAQKLTIARERARSEALLKQELSHQVAERSRELGAVLARSDVTLDARKLSPGERFAERYRVVAPLGAGGMGAVYEVERVTDGQHLALKAVVGEVSGASAARFAREAEIGARIHHEHLVSIVDVGVSSGVPFLVMELVRGGSLEAQRAMFGDPAWALPILRQVAEGLAALHDAGVVHRDLKPANVLLAEGGVAKISDFGISRFGALDEASSIDPNAATMGASPSPKAGLVTGTGVMMGTPLYMAPEAAKGGRALDAAADVFAFGIIAYEMLTGRAPFNVPAVVLAMAEQPTPTPAAIDDARVPAALRASIHAALAGDPARRPRMRALVAAMRE